MPQTIPYLDHNATTPCDPQVVAAMAPYWSQQFANPSQRGHRPGLAAAVAVDHARQTVADALGVTPSQVIFTSGATEANNLAIKGICEQRLPQGRHLVTVATEHAAVLEPCRYLERLGFTLTVLPVQPDGRLALDALAAALRPDTVLVSVMAANNEIGTLQDTAAIAALCRQRGIAYHCDAAQACGHVPLDPTGWGVDLLSLSGHKFYGPKGVGALVARPGLALAPQLHGGGQEGGYRSGSLSPPLIVGLAKALALALEDQQSRGQRLRVLREKLWQGLNGLKLPAGVELLRNGCPTHSLPHTLNVTVAGVDGARLHSRLRRRVALSSGSSCSSASGKPSHVLRALGRSPAEAAASLRFGLGRGATAADIDQALAAVQEALPLAGVP
ncbi:cysteine desulfurase family protein [Candidatus Synechococcus spongiarum]|uniref:cysteine desulfurase family protein n=1 Tax=Candidatus Synechococcus spongiarum TaxID=431041 RepID=UPI00047152C5|nr:cysteine desulfurase family protein [Candidatus Synechococcus spongiarum]